MAQLSLVVVEAPESHRAIARPLAALGAVGAIGVGLYVGSLLLAVVLVAATLGIAGVASARLGLQRSFQAYLVRRRRFERRRERDDLLERSGVPRDTLVELTMLADEIERLDPQLAHRFELEDLLDRHVALSLAHDRCLRAMRMADRDYLVRMRNDLGARRRRADMFDRRIRYWDQCKAQADQCADELATLADLVRLLAQKAACPEVLIDDDILARRLWELDEEESALRLLSIGNA